LILLDTSGVLAWIDGRQRHHAETVRAMERQEPPYLLSPFVLAELDYLIATRVGRQAQQALLEEVARGAFRLAPFLAEDVKQALGVLGRFADLQVGLADASIVVLAERHRAAVLLSLDERHFRFLPGPGGRPFRLLPADFDNRIG
jgi:predicted nucleic acid-binding protein